MKMHDLEVGMIVSCRGEDVRVTAVNCVLPNFTLRLAEVVPTSPRSFLGRTPRFEFPRDLVPLAPRAPQDRETDQ